MNALHRRTWSRSALILALLGLVAAGCDNDKQKSSAESADAGAASGPSKPVLDKKLEAALDAVEKGQQKPAADAGSAGPPESGVFTPEAAQAALAVGAAPKVELLGEGSDPKVALAFAPSGGEQKAHVVVGLRLGQSVLPNVDFGVTFKIEPIKGEGGHEVQAKVTSAAPAADQPGQLPKEATDVIGKLKGSELKFRLTPQGAIADLKVTAQKGVERGVDLTLKKLTKAITMMRVPAPDKPVGVGGYWMVTDRSATLGVEVIRYRVFRVQEIDKDKAKLSLEIRQYAAKPRIEAAGEKLDISRFESQGKGEVAWRAGALLAPESAFKERMLAVEMAGGQGGPMGGQVKGLQAETTAEVLEPQKK